MKNVFLLFSCFAIIIIINIIIIVSKPKSEMLHLSYEDHSSVQRKI
jgi:hypothetical protein